MPLAYELAQVKDEPKLKEFFFFFINYDFAKPEATTEGSIVCAASKCLRANALPHLP